MSMPKTCPKPVPNKIPMIFIFPLYTPTKHTHKNEKSLYLPQERSGPSIKKDQSDHAGAKRIFLPKISHLPTTAQSLKRNVK